MNNLDSIDDVVHHVELDEDFNEYVGDVDAMLQQESDDQWRNFLDARTNFLNNEVSLNAVFPNPEESI